MAYAIILLSGSSTRFNGEKPKQFTLINGKPLFMYSLEVFLKHPEIERVVLVTLKDYIDFVKENINYDKRVDVIEGGKTRRKSSYLGIKHLDKYVSNDSKILIHDAARPLVTSKMIDNLLEAAEELNETVSRSEKERRQDLINKRLEKEYKHYKPYNTVRKGHTIGKDGNGRPDYDTINKIHTNKDINKSFIFRK